MAAINPRDSLGVLSGSRDGEVPAWYFTTPQEDFDASDAEDVLGEPLSDDVGLWSQPPAQFIRSEAGLQGNWVGKRPLGQGGFGLAGLWEKIDGEGHVVDQIVIKQVGKDRRGRWNSDKPHEVRIMEEMNLTGCEAVVELRGYRRYMRHSIHRIYMEYCPYGDLRRLCKRYRGYRQYIPEPFLWEVFYYMTLACAAMHRGSMREEDIVHCDIKPGNVFLGLENPEALPFYPVAKMGDFGLAVKTTFEDNRNPLELRGAGTRGYMAPEQRQPARAERGGRPRRDYPLLYWTNVWAVGATMYRMLTLHPVAAVLFRHNDDDQATEGLPPIITNKMPEYSRELRSLIRECLRPDPLKRPTIIQMERRIEHYRELANSKNYLERGEDQTQPSAEERLYYRSNEIETMEPGYWTPSQPKTVASPETGFVDPSLSALRFPWFTGGEGQLPSRLPSTRPPSMEQPTAQPVSTQPPTTEQPSIQSLPIRRPWTAPAPNLPPLFRREPPPDDGGDPMDEDMDVPSDEAGNSPNEERHRSNIVPRSRWRPGPD